MIRWWQNLSVSHKLYGVVGIMALLIATELGTLYFAMNTLSAVRAFVGGEGVWSKSEKTAVYHLQKYALTRDENEYVLYTKQLVVPLGDHKARLELEKKEFNADAAYGYFLNGQIDPSDIGPMVKLIRRFNSVPQLARAIDRWREGDILINKLIERGNELHKEVHAGRLAESKLERRLADQRIEAAMTDIFNMDDKLSTLENQFSSRLGEASRWLEHLLMIVLLCAVITIESTGVILTVSFARGLSRVLSELNAAFHRVGRGDFSQRVPVRAQDELGQIASSLNAMTENLERQTHDRATAEQASETKNIFLANMSHEIRTPLNAILGFSEILSEPTLPAAERERYAAIIKRTGASLISIISDILDVAKVEADKVEIEIRDISLSQLLSDLYTVMNLRAEDKGISFIFETNPQVSERIQSDPTRLRQILGNMIGNSIKFTDRGAVSLSYYVEGDQLVFLVKDSGAGIAPQHIERLFQPFSQGDASVRKKYGGTGLGLLISQRLARLLKGDVVLLESQPRIGSTFRVTVDYRPIGAAALLPKREGRATPAIPLDGKHILVIEDSLDNQLLAKLYLTRSGATVDFAENGKEGVSKALAGSYDAILMDMQMPVMDGYSATSELRQHGLVTPIIALTGYAMKEDQLRCIEAGCSAYLAKPIDRRALITTLTDWVDSPGPTV